MATAYVRFWAELNFFLPSKKREKVIIHSFKKRPSIKDMIESLGVPHPEVKYLVVNGKSVDFSYIVEDEDQLEVYPISTQPEIASPLPLRPNLEVKPSFVLDVHLGKLAASLRMLGFDTLYRNDYEDEELAEISATQQRILLTRDKGLLMRSLVRYGYYVRQTDPQQQLIEVIRRFHLTTSISPFQRCIRCNGQLQSVNKEEILAEIPAKTRQNVEEFHRCSQCQQIYWRGAHYEQMQQFISSVIATSSQ